MKKIPFNFKKLKVGMKVELGDGERCIVEKVSQNSFFLKGDNGYYQNPWDIEGHWTLRIGVNQDEKDDVKLMFVPEKKKKRITVGYMKVEEQDDAISILGTAFKRSREFVEELGSGATIVPVKMSRKKAKKLGLKEIK